MDVHIFSFVHKCPRSGGSWASDFSFLGSNYPTEKYFQFSDILKFTGGRCPSLTMMLLDYNDVKSLVCYGFCVQVSSDGVSWLQVPASQETCNDDTFHSRQWQFSWFPAPSSTHQQATARSQELQEEEVVEGGTTANPLWDPDVIGWQRPVFRTCRVISEQRLVSGRRPRGRRRVWFRRDRNSYPDLHIHHWKQSQHQKPWDVISGFFPPLSIDLQSSPNQGADSGTSHQLWAEHRYIGGFWLDGGLHDTRGCGFAGWRLAGGGRQYLFARRRGHVTLSAVRVIYQLSTRQVTSRVLVTALLMSVQLHVT